MAVTEGHLALEFVRTLSEEAQAHRAYLQLLYVVSLGVVGGGLLILVGIFVWFGQRSIKQMQDAVKSTFDSKINSLLENHSKESREKILEIEKTLQGLRQFRSEAQRELDAIASIAGEAKAATRALKGGPDITTDLPFLFVGDEKHWVEDIIKGEFGGFFATRKYQTPDELFIDTGNPSLLVIDLNIIGNNDILSIKRDWVDRFPNVPLVILDENRNFDGFLKIANKLFKNNKIVLASGPSDFLSALRQLNLPKR